MRLSPERLASQLRGELAPVYLISGDEPLQMVEVADNVRRAARDRGFAEREILEQGPGFEWQALRASADSMSLFADRRVIDLRLGSARPGAEGAAALAAYAARPPQDALLLVTCPKLDKAQRGARWVQALDKVGVLVQVWPVALEDLPQWIAQRLRRRGLEPAPGVAALLAERVEGNLLAAEQEMEKLGLLHGPGPLSVDALLGAVTDSARFDAFDLVEAALGERPERLLRTLAALRGEGVAPAVVLWALARELRSLANMAGLAEQGLSVEQAMTRLRVWDKRKPLLRSCLSRLPARHWRGLLRGCARVDRAIKGRDPGLDPWSALLLLGMRMAGLRIVADRIGDRAAGHR